MFSLCSLLCCLLFLSGVCGREYEGEEVVTIEEDLRRPIWNVAHMVNAIREVDYYLDQGANSLEFDIWFDSCTNSAEYTYHGIPCDCFRRCTRSDRFIPFLNYMRELTTPGDERFRPELVLLFMDLKISSLTKEGKKKAGKDLATKIIDHYWLRGKSDARAYILISVPSVDDMDFVKSFRRTIKCKNYTHYNSKIGFDSSGNDDLDRIRSTYQDANISDNIWQGDGITNCLFRGTSRLRDALRRRDQQGRTYINKVYWWTVDKMSTMRTTLRMGVDGMITNYPDRLISILKEDEFSGRVRLATYEDNPWSTFAYRMESLRVESQEARERVFDTEEGELLYNSDYESERS